MSRRIGQPVTQVRLTNVAVVNLRKTGKRFEIACYKNKVVSWRQGVETDIDEVLQTHAVFLNVSKGILAASKDLIEAFGTDDVEKALRIILEKGEYHPSDKEREAMLESTYRDIATIVSEKSVNPTSNRPYTVSMVLNAMKEIHYAVNPTRSAKQQALDVIKRLKEVMPIDRAKMHLRIIFPKEARLKVEAALEKEGITFTSEGLKESSSGGGGGGGSGAIAMVQGDMLVDPMLFRVVDDLVRSQDVTQGRGSLQVVQLNVQQEGEADVDLELARKELMSMGMMERAGAVTPAPGEEEAEEEDVPSREAHVGGGGDADEEEGGGGGRGGKGGGGRKSKGARRKEKEEVRENEMKRQVERERAAARAERKRADAAAGTGDDDTAAPLVSADLPGVSSSSSGGGGGGGGGGGKKLGCLTCKASFDDTKAHREHFRSDWHRYNLKLKERGGAPVSEDEFVSVDADEMFRTDR